jgi:hypothetical protein
MRTHLIDAIQRGQSRRQGLGGIGMHQFARQADFKGGRQGIFAQHVEQVGIQFCGKSGSSFFTGHIGHRQAPIHLPEGFPQGVVTGSRQ